MTPQLIIKQMLTFQKTTFDTLFNSMTLLQKQTEDIVDGYMNKANWLPEEGKKAVESWLKACKMGQKKFKKTIDDNFDKITTYIK
jgi:polyhydroxyalkanoate synthesis regulator phasin